MSKHEKYLNRERRKADKRRRSWGLRPQAANLKPAAAALAAAAAIAAGTSAYADPIRYDNPTGGGHFDWADAAGQQLLDIRFDAASQDQTVTPASFSRHVSSDSSVIANFIGDFGVQNNGSGYQFVPGLGAGELVPTPGAEWFSQGTIAYFGYYAYGQTLSALPEGQQVYLGVKFNLGGGDQYGWIGVERTGIEVDAFAWGYETEVGVPIAAGVPEPGTLALLAVGAVGVLRRRRRA